MHTLLARFFGCGVAAVAVALVGCRSGADAGGRGAGPRRQREEVTRSGQAGGRVAAVAARPQDDRTVAKTPGGSGAISVDDAAGPEAAAGPETAAEAVQRLIDRSPLRLSTDEGSASDTFSFVTHATRRTARGDRLSSDVFVARRGRRVGILTAAPSGLPYCYMTAGLLVTTDRTNPGGLVVYTRGAPSFVLNADQDRDFVNFTLTYSDDRQDAQVVLDLRSLLRSTLQTSEGASFDKGRQRISVRTKTGGVVITPSNGSAEGAPGVTDFSVSNAKLQLMLAVLRIAVDSPPPLNLLEITEEAVAGLGLPVRTGEARDLKGMDLLVPPEFGTDPKERSAAERLLELLASRPVPSPRPPRPPAQRVLHAVPTPPASPAQWPPA